MCYALNFLGRYQEAIRACEQVEPAGADAGLADKTRRALASLRDKLAAQTGTAPTSGPDPAQPPTGNPNTGAVTSQPDSTDPAAATTPVPAGDPFIEGEASGPADGYKWSLGGELAVLGNRGIGRIDVGGGTEELYGSSGGMLRLFANFIVNDERRIGIQGYLGFGSLPPSDANIFEEPLTMVDVGGALFLDRPLSGKLYWSPLVGAHLSIQQPGELSTGFLSLGARGEVAFSYVLGSESQHAIHVTPGLSVYFPVSGEVDGVEAEAYGFDKSRAAVTVGLGYTYRFATPFGSTPLITLE